MPNWDHLPNVLQIKRILADTKARPEVWVGPHIHYGTAWMEAHRAATARAYASHRTRETTKAGEIASALAGEAVSHDATDAVWTTTHAAIQAALYALIAWDSSADLLALTPDALRTIIDTCDGDVKHQAVLLLPAVIASATT